MDVVCRVEADKSEPLCLSAGAVRIILILIITQKASDEVLFFFPPGGKQDVINCLLALFGHVVQNWTIKGELMVDVYRESPGSLI